MRRRKRSSGMALITVLLLLSVMLVMTVAVQLAVLLDASLSRNRVEYAQSSAQARSYLVQAVHQLRAHAAAGGVLSAETPGLRGLVSWERLGENTFHLVVASSLKPFVTGEATLLADSGGGLTVLQMR